jgi:hypothetical protein
MVNKKIEVTSHLKYEEFVDQRDRETTPYLVAIVKSLKEDNERIMTTQDE